MLFCEGLPFFFILTIPSVLKFFLIKFQVKFEILLISPQARGLKEGRTEVHRNIVLSVLFFAFFVIGFFYVRADTALDDSIKKKANLVF